ncbi:MULTISPECIES: hypothetical protein [Olivibacter]|jgi:hypothetical protein|uniref:Uncharacterized protein n=1 Tax=Olivibacter jilunii TaxID=985016 RepID=A0ABW6B424_9SPHI
MKTFKEFGIKPTKQGFTGDKIKISKILNKEINVLDFKIESSQFKGKCLHMQIECGERKFVVFTGSTGLIDMIQRVPSDGLPFSTTIVEENERFEFT